MISKQDTSEVQSPDINFFLRYFTGHRGKYGHEFIEYSFGGDGVLKYINGSNYKKDGQLTCSFTCSPSIVKNVLSILRESDLLEISDAQWPYPNRGGRQELEFVVDGKHYSFVTSKINSSEEIKVSDDPMGLQKLYKFVQEIRTLFGTLIQIHTQDSPI